MDAQKPPLDISITLGKPDGQHNLLNMNISLERGEDKVKEIMEKEKLDKDLLNQISIFVDFYVEQGREKEAMQYFKESKSQQFSPLQKLTIHSAEGEKQKYYFEQHQGFVRLIYSHKVNYEDGQIIQLNQNLQALENNELDPHFQASFDIKGHISHNKKNRTNVKVDYVKLDVNSQTFSSEKMINSLSAMNQFSDTISEIQMLPFFSLSKRSKQTKIEVKMDSFRKIKKFYNKLAKPDEQTQTKQFPYVNRGIFRQKLNCFIIYNSKFMVKAEARYESEDVFIRLCKVYAKFIEKLLDQNFYD